MLYLNPKCTDKYQWAEENGAIPVKREDAMNEFYQADLLVLAWMPHPSHKSLGIVELQDVDIFRGTRIVGFFLAEKGFGVSKP
jgi:hypothetical protein